MDTTSRSSRASPKKYIGIRAVATRYDVSQRTVWRLVAAGSIPPPVHLMDAPGSAAKWVVEQLDEYDQRRDGRSVRQRARRRSRRTGDSASAESSA